MSGLFEKKHNYRRVISLAILLFSTCLIAISCGTPDSSSTVDISGSAPNAENGISKEIVVATEDDYPPFDFLQNAKHVGYNQDLLELVAKAKSLNIKQEIVPFQAVLAGIASNKYQATNSAVGITKQRAEAVDFTMPITELTNFFLTRKDDASISGVEDFAGKTIAVQQGGITAAVLESSVKPQLTKAGKQVSNVKQYGAFTEAYQDLLNKRVDVVLNNLVALKRLVSEKPDLYRIGGQVGPKTYAAWAVKKGNKAMLALLNEGLAKAKASGEMTKLQEKWLKVTFNDLPDEAVIPSTSNS